MEELDGYLLSIKGQTCFRKSQQSSTIYPRPSAPELQPDVRNKSFGGIPSFHEKQNIFSTPIRLFELRDRVGIKIQRISFCVNGDRTFPVVQTKLAQALGQIQFGFFELVNISV